MPQTDKDDERYYISQFFGHYPILARILGFVSGSDAASLLSFLSSVIGPPLGEKSSLQSAYTDIYRDIPEQADWMMEMATKGHTVMLIGHDILRLKKRLKDPSYKHVDEKPIQLWMAVVANGKYTCWARDGEENEGYALVDGNCKRLNDYTIQEQMQMISNGVMGSLFPIPGARQSGKFNESEQWHQTLIPNDHKIELVCTYGRPNGRHKPNISICTRSSHTCGNPSSGLYEIVCPGRTAGWIGEGHPSNDLSHYSIPYAIMGSDSNGWSGDIFWSELYNGNDDGVLLLIELRCIISHKPVKYAMRHAM